MDNFKNIVTNDKGKKVVFLFTLVLFSILGSLIKINGISLFTALPGLYVSLFLGPIEGAIVAGLGYFVFILINGTFSDIAINILMTLGIAGVSYIFGWLYRRINIFLNFIIVTLLSGPILSLLYFINYDLTYYNAVVFHLTIINAINVILAYVIYKYSENKII